MRPQIQNDFPLAGSCVVLYVNRPKHGRLLPRDPATSLSVKCK